MKRLIIVLDGATDSFYNKTTPLIEAKTPHLDYLCQNGYSFRVKTVYDGDEVGSDKANMTLMAMDSKKYFPGRSAIELLGIGVKLASDDYTYRANLVSYQKATHYIESPNGHGVSSSENKSLLPDLTFIFNEEGFKIYSAGDHMYLLKSHCELANNLSVLDMLDKDANFHTNHDLKLKKLLKKVMHMLKGHPVNIARAKNSKPPIDSIWLWAKGNLRESTLLKRQKPWAVITATPIIKGLAKLAGDDIFSDKSFTAKHDTALALKAKKALQCLALYNTVYCHIEALDYVSHLKDRSLKKNTIEKIDNTFFSLIKEGLSHYMHPVEVYIMPDHGTCSQTGKHFGAVVPCLYTVSPFKATGNKQRFTERMAKSQPILDPKQWAKRIG